MTTKFKVGDEVVASRDYGRFVIANEYQNMIGKIICKDLTSDNWLVQIDNDPLDSPDELWKFSDNEMRHLTKLERALK